MDHQRLRMRHKDGSASLTRRKFTDTPLAVKVTRLGALRVAGALFLANVCLRWQERKARSKPSFVSLAELERWLRGGDNA